MELPKRKHTRLPAYDYSQHGAYFVTICTKDRKRLFAVDVGRGLAPAECPEDEMLTPMGAVAKEELLALTKRFPCLRIDKYVIMPNHIHAILLIDETAAGASPRPTLSDIVCAYKSLTARTCKLRFRYAADIWQTGFYDHVIRNEPDYLRVWEYIDENTSRWSEDEYYREE